MHTIDLADVGRGIHEELIAYVADQQGYYTDEGVHVAIRDGVGWDTERLRERPSSQNRAPAMVSVSATGL
jgi:hypothetical protein